MTSNQDELIIDLSNHGGPVYAGRPKGDKVREKYNLQEADQENRKVKIIIPEETYTINSSFFLGLLGNSIRYSGSKEKFLDRYTFLTPDIFKPKIHDYITRALHEKKPLI